VTASRTTKADTSAVSLFTLKRPLRRLLHATYAPFTTNVTAGRSVYTFLAACGGSCSPPPRLAALFSSSFPSLFYTRKSLRHGFEVRLSTTAGAGAFGIAPLEAYCPPCGEAVAVLPFAVTSRS
jgi:hypothetical protein